MPSLHQVKQEICAIGDRLYKRGYAAGNDGNISYRISDNEVVCTPTMISKGFMKPEDLCIVTMDGKQIAGTRKMTSEVRIHLTLMRERPEVKSVVHCHPPFATAFGIAREPVPQCGLPEVEIHLGEVPIADYAIPGGQEFADTILPFVHKSKVIILANHGTISWGETVERAYWWTEILDAYCHMLILAKQIGNVSYFNRDEAQKLLDLKNKWGMSDPRSEMKNCDICGNDVFRDSWKEAGIGHRGFLPPGTQPADDVLRAQTAQAACQVNQVAAASDEPNVEDLVRQITDKVLAALKK